MASASAGQRLEITRYGLHRFQAAHLKQESFTGWQVNGLSRDFLMAAQLCAHWSNINTSDACAHVGLQAGLSTDDQIQFSVEALIDRELLAGMCACVKEPAKGIAW